MADCYIEEYAEVGSAGGTQFANGVPPGAPLVVQKKTIGASTQSDAFNARTRMIVIVADGACHFLVGDNPTASSSTCFLPANVRTPLGVAGGMKIAIST